MIEVEALESAMTKTAEIAKATVEMHGELGDPLWVLMKAGFPPMALEKGFENERDKRLLLQAMKMLFRQHGITQYVMACEAWVTAINVVNQTSERIEALTIVGVRKGTDKNDKVAWSYPMIRKDGKVTLGEREIMPGIEGEMSSLLDD